MIRIFMVGFSPNKGGVEAFVSNLCGQLDSRRFEIVHKMAEMRIGEKTWICPPNRHGYIKYRRFWTSFFRENRFDVLYYNTCDIVSLDMVRFAKRAGVPVRIIHSHSTGIQQNISFLHILSERHNRRNVGKIATHLFACSRDAGKWMFGDADYRIIKNGIDIQKYTYCSEIRDKKRKDAGIEGLVIGCVGRLEPVKNPFFSIEVLDSLVRRGIQAALVLIGDGTLRNELEATIREKQLEHCVHLLGPRDDVNEWYSALDCLVMPSLFEGLPFTLVEAQAAGLPCVVSANVAREADLTGLVEFVDPAAQPDAWADRILEKVNSQRPDTSRMLEEKGYSIRNTADVVTKLIETALERKMDHDK